MRRVCGAWLAGGLVGEEDVLVLLPGWPALPGERLYAMCSVVSSQQLFLCGLWLCHYRWYDDDGSECFSCLFLRAAVVEAAVCLSGR